MVDNNSVTNNSYVVKVKILDVEKRYRPGPKHYVYIIEVTWANPSNTFVIYRRYAQFFDLQCKLLDLFTRAPTPSNNSRIQSREIPFLPGKIFLRRSQIRQVALERRHALNVYCQALIALPERISRCSTVLEFFRPLSTDVQNQNEFSKVDKKQTTNSPMTISEPTKLPAYRCIDDFTAVEKTEMSLKRNTLVNVIQKHLNGWWFVQHGDRTGFVPGAFLKAVDKEQNDANQNQSSNFSDEIYVVNESYDAKSKEEISLEKGSFVTVLDKSYTGWWIVRFNNITGQYPGVYLTSCEGRKLPESTLSVASQSAVTQSMDDTNAYEQTGNEMQAVPNKPELYYAHSDYIDDVGDCVSLQRGDVVEIHEKYSSGWWLGRRLKDDHVLTWIPSAFIQKEYVPDAYAEQLSHPSIGQHRNLSSTIVNGGKPSADNIYENTEIGTSRTIVVSNGAKKNQTKNHDKLTFIIPSLPSNDTETNTGTISVRALVNKFNQR